MSRATTGASVFVVHLLVVPPFGLYLSLLRFQGNGTEDIVKALVPRIEEAKVVTPFCQGVLQQVRGVPSFPVLSTSAPAFSPTISLLTPGGAGAVGSSGGVPRTSRPFRRRSSEVYGFSPVVVRPGTARRCCFYEREPVHLLPMAAAPPDNSSRIGSDQNQKQ